MYMHTQKRRRKEEEERKKKEEKKKEKYLHTEFCWTNVIVGPFLSILE